MWVLVCGLYTWPRQRASQCNTLPLTAGQLGDRLVRMAVSSVISSNSSTRRRAADASTFLDPQAITHIATHREIGKQRVVLEHHAY